MKTAISAIAIGILCGAASADDWLGEDKYMHFAVSAAISGATTTAIGDKQVGFWTGVGVGAAKEVYDAHTPGHEASVKDLAWDVLGAYAGAYLGGLAISPVPGGVFFTYGEELK